MLIAVFYFLFTAIAIISGLVSPVVRSFQDSETNMLSKRSYFLAESGAEDMLYRMIKDKTVNTSETLTLDQEQVTVTLSGSNIEADADFDGYSRKLNLVTVGGAVASFEYTAMVGEGGLHMTSSDIIGNVYANGPIEGDTSSLITGNATSASDGTQYLGSSNGTEPPDQDLDFGDNSLSQDIAQRVNPTISGPFSGVDLYIKKVGNPPTAPIYITTDNSGLPGTTVLATGSLDPSVIGTDYSWVSITDFDAAPNLNSGTNYWFVVDITTSDASNYYTIGADDSEVFDEYGKIGRYSDAMIDMPTPGQSYFFRFYVGGSSGSIEGSSHNQWNPFDIGGDAVAHTVNYTDVDGLIYCVESVHNNQPCEDLKDEPPYVDFPIPQSYIDGWKLDAESGGVYTGDLVVNWAGATLGPIKIDGDLRVTGGGTLSVSGTLWVTGNITVSGGAEIILDLDPSYGEDDGVVVADGTIVITGGASADGSGEDGSYLMLLTTSSAEPAISISGGSGAVILYAENGRLNVTGGADLSSAVANEIVISGGSDITYEDDLIDLEFPSGGSGAVSITTWKEIQ